MFYLAGQAVKFSPEDIRTEDRLVIIPNRGKDITEFYPKAQMPANIYFLQPRSIDSVCSEI